MKPINLTVPWLPEWIDAVTLWPFIVYRRGCEDSISLQPPRVLPLEAGGPVGRRSLVSGLRDPVAVLLETPSGASHGGQGLCSHVAR